MCSHFFILRMQIHLRPPPPPPSYILESLPPPLSLNCVTFLSLTPSAVSCMIFMYLPLASVSQVTTYVLVLSFTSCCSSCLRVYISCLPLTPRLSAYIPVSSTPAVSPLCEIAVSYSPCCILCDIPVSSSLICISTYVLVLSFTSSCPSCLSISILCLSLAPCLLAYIPVS
jgi:hypothetical protein